MREKVEADVQAGFGPGSRSSASPGLRLLQPWPPDEADAAGGHTWADGPPQRGRPELALVGVVDLDLGRPSAMVVMGQVLDAWRSAERQLAATVEGSLERPQIQVQVATLRSLYQGLFVQVRHAQAEQAQTGGF